MKNESQTMMIFVPKGQSQSLIIFGWYLPVYCLGRDLRDIQSRNSWIEADEVTFKDKLETKGDSDVCMTIMKVTTSCFS